MTTAVKPTTDFDASLKSIAYWSEIRGQFAIAATGVEELTRPNLQGTLTASSVQVTVDQAVSRKVWALAGGGCFLAYAVLHAAAATLAMRYTKRSVVVIGSPRRVEANHTSDTESAILPVVHCIEPTWSVKTLLAKTRQTLARAYRHQTISNVQVGRMLRTAANELALTGELAEICVALDSLHFNGADHQYGNAIMLRFSGDARALTLTITHNLETFDLNTVQTMAGHYLELLCAMVSEPDQSLQDLSFLSAQERCGIVSPMELRSGGALIHEMFETHAMRRPGAVAGVLDDSVLSYGELNAKAERLAMRLQRLGVVPDQLVCVFLERSLDLLVCFLGVLKAGGVYVPIDPDYPKDRLQAMFTDSAARVVLTQERLIAQLVGTNAHVMCIDRDGKDCETPPRQRPLLRGEHLAYCIYTSGTTGKPKAAMISHAAISDHAMACIANFDMQPSDRAILFSSVSFDVSVEQLVTSLCSGASLVVRGPQIWYPADIVERIARHQITVANVPTAYWHVLGKDGHQALAHLPLRLLVMGGEAALADPANRSVLRCRVINAYGPSEATVSPCLHEVALGTRASYTGQYLPLGEPLPNTHAYVLDDRLEPRPSGWAGEIYLAGVRLARGYLNNPALTAERFIPNPFGLPGSRMYKTGDLGRRSTDGTITFLGRTDQQVKIRGHRVEIGEVESALLRCPEVAHVVVVADQPTVDENRLVAHVVALDQSLTVESLRAWLAHAVPEYMVPAGWNFLEALPLDHNGKINRKALPMISGSRPRLGSTHVSAANDLEHLIADIWRNVLRVQFVGVEDNFFALGGHSLLAAKVVFQLERRMGRKVKIAAIFSQPTVRSLARYLDQECATETSNSESALMLGTADAAKQDAVLAADIVPAWRVDFSGGPPATIPWTRVLVTGGTGFVGRYVVAEILETTSAVVVCLIRSTSDNDATSRIRQALQAIDRWQDAYSDRIVGLRGDLSQPSLGLRASDYDRLAMDVRHIVHLGAAVNFVASYESLRATNVVATEHLLRLASQCSRKVLHYISSLSSRAAGVDITALSDNDRLPHFPPLGTGYVLSKWASERLVEQAIDRGILCSVYRLGLMTADANGRCNPSDLLYLLVHAIRALGMDAASDHAFHCTPVDSAAQAIVRLAQYARDKSDIFHICADQELSLRRFVNVLRRQGILLAQVSDSTWLECLRRHAQNGTDARLLALYAIAEHGRYRTPSGNGTDMPSRNAPRTTAALSEMGFAYPIVGDEYIELTLRFLSRESNELT